MESRQQLSCYDAAAQALAEARTVDDLKDILNKSEAIREYARRAKNRSLEVDAMEIRIRAERRYGEVLIELRASGQIIEGRPEKTVLCGVQFPRQTLEGLSTSRNFSSKCQRLAALPPDRFERMLHGWRERSLTKDEPIIFDLFAREKAERRDKRETELGKHLCALPKRRYGVIVADPKWGFQRWSGDYGRGAPPSTLDGIKASDVASIAADDCALFLWASQPILPHALEVMATWCFDYKTNFVWAKDRIGPGYWSRNKHEILLLGTRGKVPCPAQGQQWDSLMEGPRRGQSEKPEIFLEMIEAYFPNLPKINLSPDTPPRRGWDCWGYVPATRKVA